MKKFLAILAALVMVLSLTLCVAADEVLCEVDFSKGLTEFACGNWSTKTPDDFTMEDFVSALSTPGAQLVLTRSEAVKVDTYPDGYEKFCITDGWYAMAVAEGDSTANCVKLGTAVHTIEMATANDAPYDVHVDALTDDGVTITWDGNAIAEIINASWSVDTCGNSVVIISNTSAWNYDIVSLAVVVPETAAETPADETPAEDTTENTETPADTTENTETAEETTPVEKEPANTGVALAVVPMAVAAVAVALSKKR